MTVRHPLAGVATALALSAAAGPTAAAQFIESYAGTVETYAGAAGNISQDTTGVFGPAGASLIGRAFVASFVYDTASGYAIPDPGYLNLNYDGVAGSSLISANILIDGVRQPLPRRWLSGYVVARVVGPFLAEAGAYTLPGSGGAYMFLQLADLSKRPKLALPYEASGAKGYGYFSETLGGGRRLFLYLDPANVTLAAAPPTFGAPGPAPEPAVWLMMSLGLAGVGAALRDNRRRNLRAA